MSMKLLWLCNVVPGILQKHFNQPYGLGGLWMDHILETLCTLPEINIKVLCPYKMESSGTLTTRCSYATFLEARPYPYNPSLETTFEKIITEYDPDVVHIWGTEYGHSLAMVQACETLKISNRVLVNIQGLCSVIAKHYAEGIPLNIQKSYTLRDLLKRENIQIQQRKFAQRGSLEIQTISKVHHVAGRTEWDYACVKQINPNVNYHFCNETLRQEFYQNQWAYNSCKKHRVFASSCVYPVKGFHYLLEAFAAILKDYPDCTLAVPGENPLASTGILNKLRQSMYAVYLKRLIRRYHLENKVEFLGALNAEQMKNAYLSANVFVLPSTIENSPNSLGEAMLLGVPCIAAHVGGVPDMMQHQKDGFIYQPTAPYMLAHYIKKVFSMAETAETLGTNARGHALKTHDSEKNLQELLAIYRKIHESRKI